MSNIVITGIVGVGQYAVPASDAELALATAGLDALLTTIPNLEYNRVVAMVDNPEGPNGAVGARTLRCLIEEFVYNGDENPLPGVLNALAILIEAKLESDPDISTIGSQYFSLFEASEYFMWGRDAAGGFLYPVVTTDDICVGGSVVPTGKWFQDGDLVLGANAMVGTERLRVVGNAAIEGGAILTEQAATPGGDPGAGKAAFWAKNDTPNRAYFTDDANTEHRLANYFADPRNLYVSKAGSVDGDGSAEAPFLTIQAAINAAAAMVPAPSASSPMYISIGIGIFYEDLVISSVDGIHLTGVDRSLTTVISTLGYALTITNATPASLAAYNVSGDYGDLQAQVPAIAGVRNFGAVDMAFRALAASKSGIRLLGVKGDVDASTTAFLNDTFLYMGFRLHNCYVQSFGANGKAIYAKNVNIMTIHDGFAQDSVFSNVGYIDANQTQLVDLTIDYDALSAYGKPQIGQTWGAHPFVSVIADDITLSGSAKLTLSRCFLGDVIAGGTSQVTARGSYMGTSSNGLLHLNDTATATMTGCGMSQIDVEGGNTLTALVCDIRGTTTIAAGVGVVTATDCTFAGLITDASDKLSHAGEDRYGTYTEAAGAGARAVAFTPNFPNGATINVQISFEGAAVTTFKISDGTIAHTGFTLDTGGNGKFHWYAHKVK